MNLSALLAQAAAQAQTILAPMADPDGGGVFTISGTSYTGVLNLRKIDMAIGANGLERIEQLDIVATAVQFATAPEAAPRFRLTAYGRDWWCNKVDQGGTHHVFTCVPA